MPVAATMPNITRPGAAEHERRHRLDQRRHLRQQARARPGSTPPAHADPAAAHAGDADQADVLREAGVGEGVEDAADQRAQAVGAQAARQVRLARSAGRSSRPAPGTCRSTRSSPRSSPAHMVRISTGSKVGMPNWNGHDDVEPGAPCRPCRSSSCRAPARPAQPTTMPSSTEMLRDEALARYLAISRMPARSDDASGHCAEVSSGSAVSCRRLADIGRPRRPVDADAHQRDADHRR